MTAWLTRLRRHVVENANGLAVLVGAGCLYGGVAGFSRPAAAVVIGVLLLAIGLSPYVQRKRKP